MDKIIQVITTCNNKELLEEIGTYLVENRLAACAQILGPITSTYWWQGEIEQATEWVCTLKTTEGLYEKVETAILELHPYDLPEIIALDVEKSLPAYADWVRDETGQGNKGNTI
ncbi:MAG TPA: divalent-cation tolerance protein CutA [Syntrophorhabdus sp.]|nr:divalent-cation tolerance protein CutA [Syntrophorhabdus sp.]HOD77499.1 divalent-cation tolerance protein CutA [Syntrophorhabdus sp.]HQP56620.1 divalent-cation tolerance protein CutA [Syntrophorhabdus sp.]